jgi:hypothetical protein
MLGGFGLRSPSHRRERMVARRTTILTSVTTSCRAHRRGRNRPSSVIAPMIGTPSDVAAGPS